MILASKSPRRKEILENFGFNIKIITKEIEEISDKISVPEKIKDISYKKTKIISDEHGEEYVVGADTVVVVDNEILGKPKNEEDVYQMLKKLSGRSHQVITAFTIINKSKNLVLSDYDTTNVYFKDISEKEIKWYIETREPFDKAGSYGIQGKGAIFIEKIEGDFFSVVGFPLGKFVRSLLDLNIELSELKKI